MDCPNPTRRAVSASAAAAAVPWLLEDVILEILARVPARSIHRFKCVSRRWRDLITDPLHRRRFPQTLEGFFFSDGGQWDIDDKLGYIVCNPATKQWVAVPGARAGCPGIAPPFIISDGPSASPCFRLIHLRQNGPRVIEVLTYSSESGVWVKSADKRRRWQEGGGWGDYWSMMAGAGPSFMGNAFVDGMLHFTFLHHGMGKYLIVGLDWQGTTCRVMSWPSRHGLLLLGPSQGRLYCVTATCQEGKFLYHTGISIWVLQDCGAEEAEWVLKHGVSFLKLFGQRECGIHADYDVVAIHTDCNLVFFVQHGSRKLIAYDMDNEKVYVLRTLTYTYGLCTPYVPCYSELSVLANKH
ncbi:hypothetical protein U9M48_005220 [Paspalum notatum var. saurae]|uniref:F-box domain-containing protein n=1 Tax=Paspalum notatum var. saurae TaxID=547442 RepID=A0AAQ3PX32_PASNO